MQAPYPLARPWRETPAARPAFSSLVVSRAPARLSIVSTHLETRRGPLQTVVAWFTLITVLIGWFFIPTHWNSAWSVGIAQSLFMCLVTVTCVIFKMMFVWRQTLTLSEDKWEVTCRRVFGLLSTPQCASGHTAHLVAARVAATGITASQLTTAIQMLEAPDATSTASPTVRTVYPAAANSVPLSLTEQEFIVAEVNRYLERTRGTPIPDFIENTLFVDPGGVAVLAPLSHAHRCPVPPLALPVFDGGAPFARPLALVPRVPLAGCRMSASLTQGGVAREGCTIVLQRNLPIRWGSSWLTSLFWTWGLTLGICYGMHLFRVFWVLFAGSALAGLAQLLAPFWSVDQLMLSEHDWVLTQHVLGSKVRRGGQWKRDLVVDGGPLSDLLGAQVTRPPASTLCWACMTRFALASASALTHLLRTCSLLPVEMVSGCSDFCLCRATANGQSSRQRRHRLRVTVFRSDSQHGTNVSVLLRSKHTAAEKTWKWQHNATKLSGAFRKV
jgi:hypothetical protein